MNRKGIIFEGIKARREGEVCQEEAGSYAEELAGTIKEEYAYAFDTEEVCLDVTYFLVFAVSQNILCQKELKSMGTQEILHFQKLFKESGYHGEYFFSCLGYEEYHYAQVLLGMLHEIRTGEEEASFFTYQKFFAMIRKGWRGARKSLLLEEQVKFEKIQEWAGMYTEQPAMGMSQLCVVYMLAEHFGVEILKDKNYYLILKCMIDRNLIWDSRKEEILEFETWGKMPEADKDFASILRMQMRFPFRAALGFRKEKYDEFDYYLQNLFHLGGIDRNVIYGEELDEKSRRILMELGDFQDAADIQEYVYALYIVLLCRYLKKCLDKIQEESPVSRQLELDCLKKEEDTLKSQLKEIQDCYSLLKRKNESLTEELHQAEKKIRRKESLLQRAEKKHMEEHKELLHLRGKFYEEKKATC